MLLFVLLNTANVLYILSYGVRDVLWLRLLAVIAMILLMPYYALQETPMYDCMAWQCVFLAINIYWIVKIFQERKPPTMSQSEQHLYQTVFKGCCTPRNMLQLVEKAKWKDASVGDSLIKRKTELDQLLLIQTGIVSVQVKGEELATLSSGNLVGEMSFMTQKPTVADVVATGPVKYLAWQRDDLEELFKTKLELKSAIHEIIGRDLIAKLTSQTPDADLSVSISI